MTTTATFPAANYDTTNFSLTDTNETIVLTVPSTGFAAGFFIVELWVADTAGTANAVTVKVTRSGTAYIYGKSVVVAANTPLQLNPTGLVMLAGDTIKLTAGAATLEGHVSYLKNGRPS